MNKVQKGSSRNYSRRSNAVNKHKRLGEEIFNASTNSENAQTVGINEENLVSNVVDEHK